MEGLAETGATTDEAPSSGADIEDDAGTPPEDQTDADDSDSDEAPSGDEDEEGEGEASEPEEASAEEFNREAFLAKLTPAEKKVYLKQENDAKRFGRTAKQAAIMSRKLKALEGGRQGEPKPAPREEEPDPRIAQLDRELGQREAADAPMNDAWRAAYARYDAASKELQEAEGKVWQIKARFEAEKDEFEREKLEGRLDAAVARRDALGLRRDNLGSESNRIRDEIAANRNRMQFLKAERPKVEAEAKEARDRRVQEEANQAKQVAAFPSQVEGIITSEMKSLSVPIPEADKDRRRSFSMVVQALVGNDLITRHESGNQTMPSKEDLAKIISRAVRRVASASGFTLAQKANGKTAPSLRVVKKAPAVAKPPASVPGSNPYKDPEYLAAMAGIARRAKESRARNPNLRGIL